MSIHTDVTLWPALRELIPNMPEHGVIKMVLTMEGGQVPEVALTMFAQSLLGTRDPIEHQSVHRFYLVTDEDYDYIRRAIAEARTSAITPGDAAHTSVAGPSQTS
jgi:hypothetical protein